VSDRCTDFTVAFEARDNAYFRRLKLICLGRAEGVVAMVNDRSWRWGVFCALVILLGCGLYGVSVGLWRSPLQSAFTGLKFPFLIFLTCAGNGVLNGVLGQLMGTGLSFRQTAMVIMLSFTLAAMILGACAPLAFFVLLSAPALESAERGTGHSVILLFHVSIIAYAGLVANYRLLQLLEYLSPSRRVALSTLCAWVAGNLLLGTQLSWIMRPFIGTPGLPVEFWREHPLRGNFFEAVRGAFLNLL
jgi:hypothetical protein